MSVTGELFLLAITGSMGCGKSAVTRNLAQRGAYQLDADQDARALLTPGSHGWYAVLERFGPQILVGQDPLAQSQPVSDIPLLEIDRRVLGEKVFHDRAARAALEAIIHPRIHKRQARALAQWQRATPPGSVAIVVAEIPLLFETGSEQRYDRTVAVLCGQQQWSRLQERTGMSTTIKQTVISQQMSESEKKRRANSVIDNGGTWHETESQVELLWSEIKRISKDKHHFAWPRAWPEAPFSESLMPVE